MRTSNRLLVVGIVGAAAVAACIGTLTYSETEQATLSYPNPVNVGTVQVGGSVTSQSIVIGPAGLMDDDTITMITESCNAFTLNLSQLPARVHCDLISAETGGSGYGSGSCVPTTYSFTATFSPTGPGLQQCVALIHYTQNGAGSGGGSGNMATTTLILEGTGTAPQYALTINPPHGSTLAFGEIAEGQTSAAQRVTITNTGTAALTVAGTSSNPAFNIAAVNGSTFASQALAPQASASYDVRCVAGTPQTYSGTLAFTPSPGGMARSLQLTCTSISTTLGITPTPASFARETLVGAPPPDLSIQIENTGTIPTTLSSVALGTGTAVTIVGPTHTGTVLPAGAEVTVTLRYDAAVEQAFGRVDSLVVTHNPGGTRSVTINAEALIGEIGVTPPLIDFGPVCPGSEQSEGVMVYATSSGPVQLLGVTSPGAPFTTTAAAGKLEPNHGNVIELTASVSASAAGELNDTAILRTNLPGAAAMHELPVKAIALPAGVTPTPDVVHFGPNRVGQLTAAKAVTVSNCSTGSLDITGARIEGPGAADFAIVSPADPMQSVAQMGELTFLIVMNPQTPGTKIAQLIIDHAGGQVIATLDGNGFGDSDGGDGEMGTYYSCSAGGAAGGVPLVLAALLFRRRRARASPARAG